MSSKLGKGILAVLFANIINLIFNLITNFTLPKYLSIDSYAAIKSFTLYLSYAGFLHLGYEDGMYLKYGGMDKKDISHDELSTNMSTLRIFQFAVAIFILVISIILKNSVLLFFGLTILPYNMIYYFRNLYQAIGEFKLYGTIMNFTTILLFVFNMVLLFGVGTKKFEWYLIANVIVYVVSWIFLEVHIRQTSKCKFALSVFSLKEFILNIKIGFLLMLGTFSSIFLTSMDRWFVKILLSNMAFAQYSFAVSMENFLNVAISPITVTLYNYFCRETHNKQINLLKNNVIIFSVSIITCAFPAKFILETWLMPYLDSVKVVFYLFASRIFFTINTSIYVNLYKANRMQKKYFFKLILVIIFGFLSNSLLYTLLKNKESFAVATLLSSILWLLLSQKDFTENRVSLKEALYLLLECGSFLILGIHFNSILGCLIYIILTILMSCIFMKESVLYLKNVIKNYIFK